ncbi:hypothetical protein D9M70_466020 [compost metagenome]
MSKLEQAEQITQQVLDRRTEEMALKLSVTLDAMRRAKVTTSDELAEAMFPLLQAMTTLALENQVLLSEMRTLLGGEVKQLRTELSELRALLQAKAELPANPS